MSDSEQTKEREVYKAKRVSWFGKLKDNFFKKMNQLKSNKTFLNILIIFFIILFLVLAIIIFSPFIILGLLFWLIYKLGTMRNEVEIREHNSIEN